MIALAVSEEGRCAHPNHASPALLSRDRLSCSPFIKDSSWCGRLPLKNWVACTESKRQSPWPGVPKVASTQRVDAPPGGTTCRGQSSLLRAAAPWGRGRGCLGTHPVLLKTDTRLFLWRALPCGLMSPPPPANHLPYLLL